MSNSNNLCNFDMDISYFLKGQCRTKHVVRVAISSREICQKNFENMNDSFSATHLQNQCYLICFRRQSGMCEICFAPTVSTDTDEKMQASFGLS